MWMYPAAGGNFDGSLSEVQPIINTMLQRCITTVRRYFSSRCVRMGILAEWESKEQMLM